MGTNADWYLDMVAANKRKAALWDAETQRMIAGDDNNFKRNQAALDGQSGNNFNSTSSSTGASNSNPDFSWNNQDMQKGMWQQAKDMSQLQLDNTLKTMGAASGYRSQELSLNDEITRRQNEQNFGFQKTLADDNYGFQVRKANVDDEITRRQNEQRFGFERTLANDNYSFQDKQRAERERANDETMERDYQMKTETTDRARQSASSAFFGRGNRSNRFNARR